MYLMALLSFTIQSSKVQQVKADAVSLADRLEALEKTKRWAIMYFAKD